MAICYFERLSKAKKLKLEMKKIAKVDVFMFAEFILHCLSVVNLLSVTVADR